MSAQINRGFHGTYFSFSQQLRKAAYKRGIVWKMPINKKLMQKEIEGWVKVVRG